MQKLVYLEKFEKSLSKVLNENENGQYAPFLKACVNTLKDSMETVDVITKDNVNKIETKYFDKLDQLVENQHSVEEARSKGVVLHIIKGHAARLAKETLQNINKLVALTR